MEEHFVRSRIDALLKSLNKEDFLYVKSILYSKYEKDFISLLLGRNPINLLINNVNYALEKLYKTRKYPLFQPIHILLTSLRDRATNKEDASTSLEITSNVKSSQSASPANKTQQQQKKRKQEHCINLQNSAQIVSHDVDPATDPSNYQIETADVQDFVQPQQPVPTAPCTPVPADGSSDEMDHSNESLTLQEDGIQQKINVVENILITRGNSSKGWDRALSLCDGDANKAFFAQSNIVAGLMSNHENDVMNMAPSVLKISCDKDRIQDCSVCAKLLLDTALTRCTPDDCRGFCHPLKWFPHIDSSRLAQVQKKHDKGLYMPMNTLSGIMNDNRQGCSLMFSIAYSRANKHPENRISSQRTLKAMHAERASLLKSFPVNTVPSCVEPGGKRKKH